MKVTLLATKKNTRVATIPGEERRGSKDTVHTMKGKIEGTMEMTGVKSLVDWRGKEGQLRRGRRGKQRTSSD